MHAVGGNNSDASDKKLAGKKSSVSCTIAQLLLAQCETGKMGPTVISIF